jgi:surface antigen
LRDLVKKIHSIQKNIINFIKERRTIRLLHVFRNYSALVVVVSSAILVAFTNFAAGKESSGFLFGYFGTGDGLSAPLEKKISIQANNQKNNLSLVQLAQASTAPDPALRESIDSEDVLNVQGGQALVAGTSPVKKDPEEDGGVTIYEVQSGDTLGSIASNFHLKVQTILWSNALDNADSIMPGDKIFILPADGLSYAAKKGENLDAIAKKYKADKDRIIAYNDLPANGEIKENQDIIIPDGQKEASVIAPAAPTQTPSTGIAARPYESFGSVGKKLAGNPRDGHMFPYGYCTWYVAQKRYVPWSGNAGTWLYKAKSAGYATGRSPKAGSIMVTSESWWGHVALVEKVNGNGTFTVSEMNYAGFAKKSYRTVAGSSRVIKGFIY